MRLICPNCDAQYEVDAALIPDAGRDVQCSNCGKTWFQEPVRAVRLSPEARVMPETEPASEPAVASGEGLSGDGLGAETAAFFGASEEAPGESYDDEDGAERPEPDAEAVPDAEPREVELYDEEDDLRGVMERSDEAASEEAPEPTAVEPARAEEPAEPEEDETPRPDLPQRPEIDSAVLGILKAEAEREIAARRAEAEGMESQPDLGLAEPERTREPVEARTARLRGLDDEEPKPADAEIAGRKALLPDIDEINSTLTATTDRVGDAGAVEAVPPEVTLKRRSGFRMGFSIVMLATAALIVLYLFAPQIGAAVPALEPTLAGYVEWANGMRQGMDTYLERSVNSLTTFLIELSS